VAQKLKSYQRNSVVYSYAAQSDRGLVRANNEDSLILLPDEGVFGVCDGLGGHAGGEIASSLAADVFCECIQKPEDLDPLKILRSALVEVNSQILEQQRCNNELRGMATTLSVIWISPANPSEAWMAHIGDSRIYRFRNSVLEQLTDDDSPVYKLFKRGLISKDQMQRHPQKSLIDQCLGIFPQVDAQIRSVPLERGDLFLIASDGLTDNLADSDIARILAENPAETAAQELVKGACEAGGSDNISLVLIYIRGVE